jgi:hypothetical protein
VIGRSVVAVRARGSGRRFGPPVAPVAGLSAKAAGLGLRTRQDVEREFAAAKRGWSTGTEYHCPFCDRDFRSRSGASKHMRKTRHPVLRFDWYEPTGGIR